MGFSFYLLFILGLAVVTQLRPVSIGIRNGIVFLVSLFIIGFRYEMGFDWPFYKDIFDQIGIYDVRGFFENFEYFHLISRFETGFLILFYFGARLFKEYELFQAFATLLFFFSFFRLGRAMGTRNIGIALVLCHLFLLFSLEFSTLRQSVAIAFFNLGFAAYLKGKRVPVALYFLLAVTMQVSSVIYIVALLIAIGAPRNVWLIFLALFFMVLPASMPVFVLSVADLLPTAVGNKLVYYITEREYGNSLIEGGISLAFYLSVLFILTFELRRQKLTAVGRRNVLLKFGIVLVVLALLLFPITTLRNRVLYELVPFLSLLAFSETLLRRARLRFVLFGTGTLFFSIALIQTSSFMYVPYRNYLTSIVTGAESDGLDRYDRLRSILRDR
jgi:hypothetical protein